MVDKIGAFAILAGKTRLFCNTSIELCGELKKYHRIFKVT